MDWSVSTTVELNKYLDDIVNTDDISESLTLTSDVFSLLQPYNGYYVQGRNLELGRVLQLLSYLEKLHASSEMPNCDHIRVVRNVADLIVTLRSCTPIPSHNQLPRPAYSPLMIQTEDSSVLKALCSVLHSYVGTEDCHTVVNAELAQGVTVLDRLLDLLHHPSWSLRRRVVSILHAIAMTDDNGEFYAIGERLVRDGGDLLISPERQILSGLFFLVAWKYQSCLGPSIDSGLVSNMLLLLEAYTESSQPSNLTRYSSHDILFFLDSLVEQCTQGQMQRLDAMGCFDLIRRIAKHPCVRDLRVTERILAGAADKYVRLGNKKRRMY
eukprot:Protomagalhaensia_sp_Gyna_25__1480@NODE_1755_length_1558_cov_41_142199_g1438_i0_p1_GENE_NODE_1755_length_1558_cov_41_142199_g1438_i0NODE_1755_length_1558_cov_41_142199_g1438_i0_p1_ORF_typecomplete_len326_score19_47MitMem_reg/PF13012_6/0_07MitMem_reg/PF13012_6/88HEAT_2/PF13646_6/0_077_NODE_1755_length_1558_cov_41_142199_g1438_i05181495